MFTQATAVREAVLSEGDRDEDILLKICATGCRSHYAEFPYALYIIKYEPLQMLCIVTVD